MPNTIPILDQNNKQISYFWNCFCTTHNIHPDTTKRCNFCGELEEHADEATLGLNNPNNHHANAKIFTVTASIEVGYKIRVKAPTQESAEGFIENDFNEEGIDIPDTAETIHRNIVIC
jgi:hypothetical protein